MKPEPVSGKREREKEREIGLVSYFVSVRSVFVIIDSVCISSECT